MALIDYQQTDTAATFNIGCSGQTAGVTTDARQMTVGGTAGVTGQSCDPGNNVTRACVAIDGTAPGASASWNAGNWTIRINHTTMDGGTSLTRIDVCDFNGTSYTTVVSDTAPGHSPGATGVFTRVINQPSSHTPQSASLSRPFIVFTYTNTDPHGASGFTYVPSEIINTPIDDGAAATSPKQEPMGIVRSW